MQSKNSTPSRAREAFDVTKSVITRFGDLSGSTIASSLTLSLFLSIFPLILVAVAVLGFVAAGKPTLINDAIDSMGLTGSTEDMFVKLVNSAQDNRGALTAVAFLSGLWSALGVGLALQQAANLPWQVVTAGLMDRVKALGFLAAAGLLFAASFAVTAAVNWLAAWFSPISIVVSLAMSVALFALLFKMMCTYRLPLKTVLPGSIMCAIGFEVLKWLAANWLPGLVSKSSAMYGSIGVVLALLAWLLLFGKLLVYSSVLNVIMAERKSGTITMLIEMPAAADKWGVTTARRGGLAGPDRKPMKIPGLKRRSTPAS